MMACLEYRSNYSTSRTGTSGKVLAQWRCNYIVCNADRSCLDWTGGPPVLVLIMMMIPATTMMTTTTTMMACLDGTGAHLYNFPMQQLTPQQALSSRGLENLSSTQLIVLLNFNQYLDIYLCSMTKQKEHNREIH